MPAARTVDARARAAAEIADLLHQQRLWNASRPPAPFTSLDTSDSERLTAAGEAAVRAAEAAMPEGGTAPHVIRRAARTLGNDPAFCDAMQATVQAKIALIRLYGGFW